MRSLFLKIFLWFWLALALLAAALVGVSVIGRPEHTIFEPRRGAGPFGLYAHWGVAAWESGEDERWTDFREDLARYNGMNASLLDAEGAPLTEGAPAEVGLAAARRALEREETIFAAEKGVVFIAVPVRGAAGRPYVFLLEHPERGPRRGPGPFLPPGRQGILLLAAVLIAGVVCLGLARYLAAPVARLREATRRFADGDLSARALRPGDRRRDEVADLGRDFDRMADRVQGLLVSQRELLRDVSHELRSPLARLGVALELARNDGSPDVRPALDRIEREATRLNELIGRILALSRLESRELLKADDAVDLGRLLAEIRDDAAFEASGRGLEVTFTGATTFAVTASRDLLRSAIENVVRNAIRHGTPGTAVEIELVAEPDVRARIAVRDRGPGVPADRLDDMFRAYERLGANGSGSGLGLSIARRVVDAYGGLITARNRSGGGLVVEIVLPGRGEP